MFNGGADLNGQTFATVNGYRIALPGDEVRIPGDWYWSDTPYTGSTATFQGQDYVYNNIDDLYAAEYIAQNKSIGDQQYFWTGETHGVSIAGNKLTIKPTQRVDPSSTPWSFEDMPATALMAKVVAASSSNGVDKTVPIGGAYIGDSTEIMGLNPDNVPPDGNRWYSHYVVFMYEMPVI